MDIEDLVMYALMNAMKLDPGELAKARLELAGKYLSEAKEYIDRGDAVQASEKLYKAVEECIKRWPRNSIHLSIKRPLRRVGGSLTYLVGQPGR